MNFFPAVDPIPLPAPVWLFKALHLLTFALHVVSVELLLGGALVATLWALWGRSKRDPVLIGASGAVAHRLPVVVAYVINLGVPPLLFTQVLYGRALYTSTILIGAVWISVIFLLMAAYHHFYAMASRAERGKSWGGLGVIAFCLCALIAFIYSTNMTLMLRPGVWLEMYRANPHGTQLAPGGDATLLPRWTYMLTGSLGFAGLGLVLLGLKTTLDDSVAAFLRTWGGRLLVLFILVQAAVGYWVYRAQPEAVREALWNQSLATPALWIWVAGTAALVLIGLVLAARGARRATVIALAGVLAALVQVAGMVIFRDAIRDATLGLAGFQVWDRTVAANWPVVVLFLVLFVGGLAGMAWMISVVARAKGGKESYV